MITPPALMAPSGRIFIRHSSGMGSVMIFNDRGTWRRVLVLDSKYRTEERFGLLGIRIPEFQKYQMEEANTHYLDYPMYRSTEAPDSWISENITWDPMTSRERCDVWMKYKDMEDLPWSGITGCPAVQHCRSIQVNSISCDLPNIQTLARIYVDRWTIDQMDPTIERYSDYRLKMWSFFKAQSTWSSSPWYISDNGCSNIRHDGPIFGYIRNYKSAIIPILEL